MSLIKLPEIKADVRLNAGQFDLRQDAVDKWSPEIKASKDDASISILDVIGENWEGSGVTSKRVAAALRNIGERDVVVDINSPGGDFFEGVAIYNQLREHKGKVTVRVLSLAASAASVIAMAGDEILMGEGAFLMIHNAWAVAIGNRNDLADAAKRLEPFDAAMASLYAKRAGISEKEAAALMDDETWINAERAIEDGFATGYLSEDAITADTNAAGTRRALALVDVALAKAGYARNTRRETLKNLFIPGTPCAAGDPATPCAGLELVESLQSVKEMLMASP